MSKVAPINDRYQQTLKQLEAYENAEWVTIPLRPMLTESLPDGSKKRICNCGDQKCPGPGKHPNVNWGEIQEPIGMRNIEYWLSKNWKRGWAVILGPSRLCALDVDPRNGGTESLARLESEIGAIPRQLVAATGGGGLQFFFSAAFTDLPRVSKLDISPGIEFLSGPHISVIPPSPHKSGGRYRWLAAQDPTSPPSALVDLLWQRDTARGKRKETVSPDEISRFPFTDFDAVQRRARAYIATIPPAIQGQNGSKVTFYAACTLVRGFALSPSEAFPLLVEYSNRCSPPWSEAELWHKLRSADAAPGPRGSLLENRSDRNSSRERWLAKIDEEIKDLAGVNLRMVLTPEEIIDAAPTPTPNSDGASTTDNVPFDVHIDRSSSCGDCRPGESTSAPGVISAPLASPVPFPCTCPNKFFQTAKNNKQSRVVYVRCKECFNCIRFRKNRWIENFRTHLGAMPATGYRFWSITVPYDGIATWKKRHYDLYLRQFAGRYARIDTGGAWLIVGSAADRIEVKGGVELSNALAAADLICRAIEALVGRGRCVHAGKRWGLPRRPQRSDKWSQGRRLSSAIGGRLIEIIADANEIEVNQKTVHPALQDRFQRIWQFEHPQWDRDRVEHLYTQLYVMDYIPYEEPESVICEAREMGNAEQLTAHFV